MPNPSFREFVIRHFGSRINQLVEEYVTDEFDDLEIRTPLKDIDSVSCESTDITTVRIYDAGHTALKFEVDVKCEIDVSGYYCGDIESFPYSPWFTVKCKGDLSHTLDKWYVGDVIPYGDATKKKSDLSDSLIPYVSADNYEKYAEAFLGKNYSQALTEPKRIAPLDLATRMNLKVRQHSISKDCSVFV
ncbi:MAG: hypothetical protein K6G51_03895 [Sphaerochaetaceae bacterium]|nr:hypothetical protein [Sphaerochaetaceae bacterium]